jgi:hypothetical protein|tara:strand:- start:1368 stop:1733 length:366 start_codon:yes stop_codon:yes gene_type:complete
METATTKPIPRTSAAATSKEVGPLSFVCTEKAETWDGSDGGRSVTSSVAAFAASAASSSPIIESASMTPTVTKAAEALATSSTTAHGTPTKHRRRTCAGSECPPLANIATTPLAAILATEA